MNPLVSVIMPVYNAKDYLAMAIESVLKQTYKNFELILSDDGSTDGSELICDCYAQTDNRVVVIHKKNGGISSARNYALDMARGKYIAFCDHDDIMKSNCLEKALTALQETGADFVRFLRGREIHTKHGVRYEQTQFPEECLFDEIDWATYKLLISRVGFGVWSGIYSRKWLLENHIRFCESVRYGYEDNIFISECYGAIGKLVVLPEVLYIWVQRENVSTSMKCGMNVFKNRMEAIRLWFQVVEKLALRLGPSAAEYNLHKLIFLNRVMQEIDHTNMKPCAKRRVYKEFQREISFDSPKCHIYGKSLKKTIKNWCLCNGAVRSYHFFYLIKEYAEVKFSKYKSADGYIAKKEIF